MAGEKDGFGEGSNYFSVFKVGGVRANSYSTKIKGQPNPGTRTEIVYQEDGKTPMYDELTGEVQTRLVPQNSYVDGSDALANSGFTVTFQSAINGTSVAFKAFITAFNETYNCNWNSEEVYGRTDPIHMFKNTTRDITVSLMVPAATQGEAYENILKVQQLIQKLYPAYSDVQGAQTIAQSPLIRMKVVNMTQKYSPTSAQGLQNASLNSFMTMTPDAGDGLLGIIKNLTVNHHIDDPNVGVFEISPGVILPKLIELQISFGAIHEATAKQSNVQGDRFPYNFQSNGVDLMTKEAIDAEYSTILSQFNRQAEKEREEEHSQEMADQARANSEMDKTPS